MSQGDSKHGAEAGVEAYLLGVKLLFWGYALFLFLRIAGPAADALGAASNAGPYSEQATGAVLVAALIAVAIGLFLGVFVAVFLFVSVHATDVVLSASIAPSGDAGAYLARSPETVASDQVVLAPELFFPPEVAWLAPLVPPALLIGFGYLQGVREGAIAPAVTTVVIGYAVVTVLTIVPVTWVFNAVVGEFVGGLASTAVTDAVLAVEVPNLLQAHLLVGVVYPALFGGIGAFLADLRTEGAPRAAAQPAEPE